MRWNDNKIASNAFAHDRAINSADFHKSGYNLHLAYVIDGRFHEFYAGKLDSQSAVAALYVLVGAVTPEIRFVGMPVNMPGTKESSALRVALSILSMRPSPLSNS